ncbi:MAG: hypothetical protein MJ237_07370, partial [bacterium]|nr:hypothetical protein [bacterium]
GGNSNCVGLQCRALPTSPLYTELSSQQQLLYQNNNKFANLFAAQLELSDSVVYRNSIWSFHTNDGIEWRIQAIGNPRNGHYRITILLPNKPDDTYEFELNESGQIYHVNARTYPFINDPSLTTESDGSSSGYDTGNDDNGNNNPVTPVDPEINSGDDNNSNIE